MVGTLEVDADEELRPSEVDAGDDEPYSSSTGICVWGRGKPALTNNNRVSDS